MLSKLTRLRRGTPEEQAQAFHVLRTDHRAVCQMIKRVCHDMRNELMWPLQVGSNLAMRNDDDKEYGNRLIDKVANMVKLITELENWYDEQTNKVEEPDGRNREEDYKNGG